VRGWIVLVMFAGCSEHREPRAKVLKGSAEGSAQVAAPEGTAADKLVDQRTCSPVPVPASTWIGSWRGQWRHGEPAQLAIVAAGDKLHVAEPGVELDLALAPDGIVASGQAAGVAVAACFDVHKALHLWRVLGANEDEVVLAQVP